MRFIKNERDNKGRWVKGSKGHLGFKKKTLKCREIKYKIICPDCLKERKVNYCQFLNIKNKSNSGMCYKCSIKHRSYFNNYSSYKPYTHKFNDSLKLKIKKKYGFRCQECFRHQSELKYPLTIHHIDFNKQNDKQINLIPLCHSCHSQTIFKKGDWIKYYQSKII